MAHICQHRLITPGMACCRDVLYLDLALEAAGRSLVEARIADVKRWAGERSDVRAMLALLAAALENACLALGSNQELVLCYKDLWVRARSRLRHARLQCVAPVTRPADPPTLSVPSLG